MILSINIRFRTNGRKALLDDTENLPSLLRFDGQNGLCLNLARVHVKSKYVLWKIQKNALAPSFSLMLAAPCNIATNKRLPFRLRKVLSSEQNLEKFRSFQIVSANFT
jgi:hypothetical protein